MDKPSFKGKTPDKRALSFVEFCKALNSKYDYSRVSSVKNYQCKVTIGCPQHGFFIQRCDHHLNGSKCPDCVGGSRVGTVKFIHRAQNQHGNKFDYSQTEYLNSHTRVVVICRIHGPFLVTPRVHLENSGGCDECINRKRYSTSEFIEVCRLVHGGPQH